MAFNNDWQQQLKHRINALTKTIAIAEANAAMIARALEGMGPDSDDKLAGLGARVVFNMSSVHVPDFCKPNPGEEHYKNGYDLGKYPRMGATPPTDAPRRVRVDSALGTATGIKPEDTYFGAVELNGSGIRFYGDFCLVLQREKVGDKTVVLSSNSYDLLRPPITTNDAQLKTTGHLEKAAEKMAGNWKDDLAAMGALKTFGVRLVTERRITTAQISEGILEDEDYLEVLKQGSFGPNDLQEVRLSAAEVAAENDVGERERLGPCPSLAELQWREHRRVAIKVLQESRVHTRVVTTLGRVR